jgi:uncharacterized iron-regulated membrane protein
MSTIAYVVGGLALTGAVIVGLMFWVARRLPEQSIALTEKRRAEFADDERH